MIKRTRAVISKMIIHKVGNKFNSASNVYSEDIVRFDEESYQLMLPFLLKPFASLAESYRFNHHANIELNEINHYSDQIFQNPDTFVAVSKHIVDHLFEQSNAAQIKIGDVLVVLFEDIEFNEITTNALGIFKIENKVDFFQTYMEDNSLEVFVQKGISTKKIDKGCLVINYADAQGRTVLSVDNNNYDAQYWLQYFLNITYADDYNQHTNNYMEMCKDFSNTVLREDFGIQEQNKFLARTVDYFKEHDSVDYHQFTEELFEQPAQKELFSSHKKQYEDSHDLLIRNQFEISDRVVKKQKQQIKTDIKLDTHIQIKLDIDAPDASSEYLEKGYDEEKKMRYYKVYFNEER
ncbi:MAG: nucleoid-associated protein [Lutibacter sp.]|nr:nucleoid-associated protein [Lutibacter sp.]